MTEPELRGLTSKRMVNFCRKHVRHIHGPMRGRPFVPEPWQIERIFKPVYDTRDADGLRQYRHVYCEMARKQGKSFIASAIALAGLILDGEPGASVISAAGTRDQAALVFDCARQIVLADPMLSSLCKIYKSAIECKVTGGVYKTVSAQYFSAHGLNISTLIFDEFWVQKTSLLYEALTTSMGARKQPLTFIITTSGFDKKSICYEQHSYAKKVQAGLVEDKRFLPILFGADENDDWTSPEVWRKANPNLGVTVSEEFLAAECRAAQENPSREIGFRQLYLSQWVTAESRWFSQKKLEECMVPEDQWPDFSGEDCWLGLDLSSNSDLTSVAACFYRDGLWWLDSHSWCPRGALANRRKANRAVYDQWAPRWCTITQGDVIDFDEVKKHIDRMGAEFHVVEAAADKWNATALANTLQSEGLTMIGFAQNFSTLSPATKDFEALALSGKLRIKENPLFRWAFSNVCIIRNSNDDQRPDKSRSGDKIDPIVAALMAVARCRLATSSSESIYSDGGMMIL